MILRLPWIATLLLSLVGTAIAQTRPSDAPSNDPTALLDRTRSITKTLSLSAAQQTQIDAIFKQADDDLQSATQDLQNASADEKAERYRQLFADLRQQIGQVLTSDQKSQFQQQLQELRGTTTAPAAPGAIHRRPTGGNPGGGVGGGAGGGAGGAGGMGGGPGRGRPLQQLRSSIDQLNLTPDQQSQVDDVLKQAQQQLLALRSDMQNGSADRNAVRQRGRQIFEDAHTKLTAILTPDQQDKLRDLLRGNGGSPPPPPVQTAPPPIQTTPKPATAPSPILHPPAAGEAAPDFSLKTLNGQDVKLSDFNHKLLVLVLGSFTNPSFRDRAAGLETLRNQYGTRVSFLIVYTRETHPTGGWEVQRNKTDNIDVIQPTTLAQRKATADRAKSALKLSIPFAVDSMDDKTDAAYAVGEGTPAYLIGRDGKIVFHQSWLEPMALDQAIQAALK